MGICIIRVLLNFLKTYFKLVLRNFNLHTYFGQPLISFCIIRLKLCSLIKGFYRLFQVSFFGIGISQFKINLRLVLVFGKQFLIFINSLVPLPIFKIFVALDRKIFCVSIVAGKYYQSNSYNRKQFQHINLILIPLLDLSSVLLTPALTAGTSP